MTRKIFSLLTLLLLTCLPAWALAINFTPSSSDPSVMYLSYIFGVVNGVLSGSGTQILGKMFNVFNMSILMLGSIIAVYTTIMAVLNSGQDGEFMGKKWSSLFVPLRVLLGVLLIAPTTTGYSLIQVGVMWIVLQGVGAANYIWSEVITYLTQGGTLFTSTSSGSSSSYSGFYSSMNNLSDSVFCLDAMGLAVQKLTSSSTYLSSYLAAPSVTPYYSVMNTLTSQIYSATTAGNTINMPSYTGTADSAWGFLDGMCGKITYSGGTVQTSSDQVNTATVPLGIQQGMSDLNMAISPLVNNICAVVCPDGSTTTPNACSGSTYPYGPTITTNDVPSGCAAPAGFPMSNITAASPPFPYYYWYNNSISDSSYVDAVSNATNALIGMVTTYTQTEGNQLQGNTSDWLQAGNYFFQLMSYVGGAQSTNGTQFSVGYSTSPNSFPASGGVSSTTWIGIPATVSTVPSYISPCPQSGAQGCTSYPTNGQATLTQQYLQGLLLPLVAGPNTGTTTSTVPAYVVGNFLGSQANQGSAPAAPMSAANSVTDMGSSASAALFAGGATLFDDIQTLTAVTSTANNPIFDMMTIGNDMIQVAFDTWITTTLLSLGITLAVSFIPSMSVASGFLPFTNAILSMVMALAMPLIAAGGMLLYYFPMVPFMIYAFGVIGWFFGVIEGMVAAPIVGIGIMHPDGHEVFGKGEQALMLLLNMFLRPSLMVFGLVVSIMLVYISVWIINSGINNSIEEINDFATSWADMQTGMGYFMVPIVYVVIIFNVTNKCFTMIYVLPDKVTRWLSGGMQESLGSDMGGMVEAVKSGASAGMSAYGSAIGQGGGGHAGQSTGEENAGAAMKSGGG